MLHGAYRARRHPRLSSSTILQALFLITKLSYLGLANRSHRIKNQNQLAHCANFSNVHCAPSTIYWTPELQQDEGPANLTALKAAVWLLRQINLSLIRDQGVPCSETIDYQSVARRTVILSISIQIQKHHWLRLFCV